jgi:hypothetical protein
MDLLANVNASTKQFEIRKHGEKADFVQAACSYSMARIAGVIRMDWVDGY